jgi:ABC-2 type transport system ATP-binding protein
LCGGGKHHCALVLRLFPSPPALIYPFLPFLVRKSDMSSALSIRQLTKTYGNGFQALSGIDLDVAEGDFFALLGPNGAGKSTTIGILSTLVNKTSGTVNIFGHDLDKDPAGLKRCIGVVPQEFNFNQFEKTFDIVVTQAGYYGIPPKIAKERAEQYLTQLGLWDKRDVPSRSLSGGMKRRLMIARALVHEPRLLILDEPTAGVDIELRRSMWTFLTELNKKGITIILTTHYLEEAEQLCRNIGIIDHGTIVENTSMKQLLSQLHVETFLLDLKNTLSAAPQLLGYPTKLLDSHTLEVQVDKAMGITALFTQLAQQNIEALSLRNKTNRLEELFVSLVEKNLSKVAL